MIIYKSQENLMITHLKRNISTVPMKLFLLLVLYTVSLPNYRAAGIPDLKNWWKNAVLYQIYPRSFADSNGDGVGDLKGIESKLDYLKYLGVNGTWLSPVYKSPMKDFGYDISNYTSIDPLFGTMGDFDSYVNKSKKLGLKVIMDFVPNHTSNESEWFIKSERKQEPYTDYYVWVDGLKTPKGPQPPNNWQSVFGGSAWEWSPIRKQFYYHAFLAAQPDLNYTNPRVREEIKKVLRFWFDKKIDGLRIDAIPFLFEDPLLRNEPPKPNATAKPGEYNYYDHIYTWNLPKTLDVLAEWKQIYQDYENRDGEHRVMILETGMNATMSLPYFGNATHPLADMPFNFQLILNLRGNVTGEDVYNTVSNWLENIPKDKWSNWVLGNHDQNRIANRTNVELIDAFNMISLLTKGTPFTYYGEEIGMVDKYIPFNETQDPYGKWFGPKEYQKYYRDPERTPMQWDDTAHAGFTRGKKPWLPVNENYKYINVKKQQAEPRSHLNTYRRLVALKKNKAIINGSVDYPLITKNIYSFTRTLKTHERYPGYVVVINFGNKTQHVDLNLKGTKDFYFPLYGTIEAMSDKVFPTIANPSQFRIDLSKIILPPRQAVVIRFLPLWKSRIFFPSH